jgi:hypothetical protein
MARRPGRLTGTGTGGTQFNGPPRLYEFVGDSDGDGIPDLRCANFPPNTVCTIAECRTRATR